MNSINGCSVKQKRRLSGRFEIFQGRRPNEFHKGRMASVIFHAFGQIMQSGKMNLFRSHKPEFLMADKKEILFTLKMWCRSSSTFIKTHPESGIYNLGTGRARRSLISQLTHLRRLDLEPQISFIDTPEHIREKYQYFTEASMEKLRAVGYKKPFYT